MPADLVPLDDPDDPRLAVYRNLKATNETRGTDLFVVEGLKLAERLWSGRFPVVSVLASDRVAGPLAARVPGGVPLYVLPQAVLQGLVGYNFHQGVLACGRRLPWPPLDAIVGAAGPRVTVVVCPRIDNPENLGAVVRIADVFGASAVVVGPRAPDPLSRRVLRVSMGTALGMPVVRPDDLAGALERLRDRHGFRLAATVCAPPAVPLGRYEHPGRLALLLGNEGNGLEPEWVDRCDVSVTIPMRPGAESLNVAVAAGILLYHLSDPTQDTKISPVSD